MLERSVTEQRYEAVIQVVRHQVPVTEVATRFGVSRQSVPIWIRGYEQHGLVDRLHRPVRGALVDRGRDLRRQADRGGRPGPQPRPRSSRADGAVRVLLPHPGDHLVRPGRAYP
jgi:transposase-like protein